jgi:hypothetical protein
MLHNFNENLHYSHIRNSETPPGFWWYRRHCTLVLVKPLRGFGGIDDIAH